MEASGIIKAAGTIGNTVGAISDLAGAFVQRKAAKKNLELGNKLADSQRLDFQQTYGDLFNLLGGQDTYKKDISEYKRAEAEAERQQIMAQNVPVSDQLYRDQAGRTSANTFARAMKGARSGTDLMSLAGMVGDQENQQMQGINIDTANRGQTLQQQANQYRYSSIIQTAAATARERGMEFDSILNKSNAMIGLTKDKGLGDMDLEWNLGQTNMAQRGALANSNAAMISGMGGVFKAMGGGIAKQNLQDQQMLYLQNQMRTPTNYNPFMGQTGSLFKADPTKPADTVFPKGFNGNGTFNFIKE